jgi:hypothetical protein
LGFTIVIKWHQGLGLGHPAKLGLGDPALADLHVGAFDSRPRDPECDFLPPRVIEMGPESVIECRAKDILGVGRKMVPNGVRQVGIGLVGHIDGPGVGECKKVSQSSLPLFDLYQLPANSNEPRLLIFINFMIWATDASCARRAKRAIGRVGRGQELSRSPARPTRA